MFPPDNDDEEDAISLKIFLKNEGSWAVIKNVLGFDFDGNPGEHILWLADDRHTSILTKTKKTDS